jgi:hypothetical protein
MNSGLKNHNQIGRVGCIAGFGFSGGQFLLVEDRQRYLMSWSGFSSSCAMGNNDQFVQ